jgi:hypothetical protein
VREYEKEKEKESELAQSRRVCYFARCAAWSYSLNLAREILGVLSALLDIDLVFFQIALEI